MKSKPLKNILIIIISLSVILSVFAISYFHLLDSYELVTLDIRFLLRPKIPTTDKVVIIEIGEDTLEKLGRFPFDRNNDALMVKALSESGARCILYDILFSEPHEQDRQLEEAMKSAGNVYLPYAFDIATKKKYGISSASGYRAKILDDLRIFTKGEGHVNIEPDIDGKFRKVPLYIEYKGSLYPFVSFLIACDYLGIPEKSVKLIPGRRLIYGRVLKIPLDENSNMIVNFSGRWKTIYKHYSYVDILQSYLANMTGQKPSLDLNIFKDKICIICLTAAGTTDLHPNPFEPLYPAAGIHAEVFNSILNKRFVTRASREINLAILAILAFLISLITFKTKPLKGILALMLSILFYSSVSIFLFNLIGLWVDMFYPILIMGFVYITITLYKYVAEQKKRLLMEKELTIAKSIQESFLPKRLPVLKGMDISAAMFTARQVGGDLYDFIEFADEKLGVMIGDVSGKGIPASLFMAMVVSAFRSLATAEAKPEEALSNLNSKLIRDSSSNLFVTIFYSIFDTKNKVMTYANGGHLPVLYFGKGKEPVFLDTENGMPLGLMEGPYSSRSINFNKGDFFIFYTDGITEAMNPRLEMYERERLVSIAKRHRDQPSKIVLDAIEKDVRRFESKAIQHDDITGIAIKIL